VKTIPKPTKVEYNQHVEENRSNNKAKDTGRYAQKLVNRNLPAQKSCREGSLTMPEPQVMQQRLHNWCQTSETHLSDDGMAPAFIERVGIATLYPASTEIPNLFSAYVGDPDAKTDAGWDTPSGEVYTWRWTLGRKAVAFYTALIRRRPTWIRWSLLPAILRLRGVLQMPEELYETGLLSLQAYRIAQTLEATKGVLSTGELREQAGFPRGTASRTAYLKAVEELETHLLLAKIFQSEGDNTDTMHHALVRERYPDQVAAAERMSLDEALDQFLLVYLPQAVYANPPILAKDLKLPAETLYNAFERMVSLHRAIQISLTGKSKGYLWNEQSVQTTSNE
jgi:hypothetical protein